MFQIVMLILYLGIAPGNTNAISQMTILHNFDTEEACKAFIPSAVAAFKRIVPKNIKWRGQIACVKIPKKDDGSI